MAWLASDLPVPARRELDRRGLGSEPARSALRELGPDPGSTFDGEGTTSAPSWHTARGRAGGICMADDRLRPSPDEIARACVWDLDGRAAALLAGLGRTGDDVLAVAGELPAYLPAETLLPLAQEEAAGFDDGYVGDVHVVLAVLAGEPDGLAAEVLDSCGITYDRVAASHREMRSEPPAPGRADPARPPAPSPACRGLLGRAQALAAARGAGAVGSEHALVAWLWRDDGQAAAHLERLGTTATAVIGALGAAGARVPAVPPPEPDRRAWGERVTFPLDRLNRVRSGLVSRLAPGDWGWNVDEDLAWVVAVAGIDLQAVVDEILA